jgi:hypothetical protein
MRGWNILHVYRLLGPMAIPIRESPTSSVGGNQYDVSKLLRKNVLTSKKYMYELVIVRIFTVLFRITLIR